MSLTEPMSVKSRTTILEMERRSSRRKKKGKKKKKRWENLRERGIGGINSTPGVGLTSWNGKPGNSVGIISGGRIPGIFYGNPNPPNVPGGFATKSLEEKSQQYSPRDNDADVFVDIESARRRARQIGCIGVSRRVSKSGKTVWMPCTNLTDYNNLTGMTSLGRLNQEKNTQKIIRTVLSQELKKRKKSLVEEIIGKAIGPKISGVSRFAARTITQRFDPNAEDGDGDGLLQDGTAFERPNIPKPKMPVNIEQSPISQSSIDSVGKWFDKTPSSRRQELFGEPIENFSIRGRSTRGFASTSQPIKGENFGVEGLENPDASPTNPFKNLGGRKMGEIIRGLVKPKNKGKKQRTTYLVGGTTGGGKTTVLDEHLVPRGLVPGRDEAAHVDPDFIKMGLPGYSDGAGAPMVHDESLRAAQHTMDDARKEGADVVATGAGSTRQRAIIAQARQNGDRVVAHWVHISQAEASRRLRQREKDKGRKIPDQTDHFARSIPRMVSSAVANGEVDEFYIWDNEVELGKPPRLLASFKDGKLEVFDQKKLDEFMNGNPLNPKPGKNSELSSEARGALDESDKFMAEGLASSSKKSKKKKKKNNSGRTTPSERTVPTIQAGGTVFGDLPGTGRVTSVTSIPEVRRIVDDKIKDLIKEITDYLASMPLADIANLANFSGQFFPDRSGNPLNIASLSLRGKFKIPEDIDKIVDIYAPIKNPGESWKDFAGRVFSSVPSMRYTIAGSMARMIPFPDDPGRRLDFWGNLIKNLGYSEQGQIKVREVLTRELRENPAFAELVLQFGLPFIMSGTNEPDNSGGPGINMEQNGTGAYHSPIFGALVMGKHILDAGRMEVAGSTKSNPRYNTVYQVLRHEWFHYLDAVTVASDGANLASRLADLEASLTTLSNDPEKVIRRILGDTDMMLREFESDLLKGFTQLVNEQQPGLSRKSAKILAQESLRNFLQNPAARQDLINALGEFLKHKILPDLASQMYQGRGGRYADIAEKVTPYAGFSIYELVAELGRILTATAAERASLTGDTPKISKSVFNAFVALVPSLPKHEWLRIVRLVFPGAKIQ